MNEHNATEQAYRNGYEKGRAEAIQWFAEKAKENGIPVTGGKGFEGVTSMTTNIQIDTIAQEMRDEQ